VPCIFIKPNIKNEEKWNDLLEYFWEMKNELVYYEFKFNCLDFILSFLILFGYFDVNDSQNNEHFLLDKQNIKMKIILKQKITKQLIEPALKRSLRYLYLLMKINKESFLIENQQ